MGGTIDQLNFEVILTDEKFDKRIRADLKLAESLNTELSNLLNLKKRLNGETTKEIVNAEKVRQAEEKTAQEKAKTAIQQQKLATEVEKTRNAQEKHTGAVQKTNAALTNTTSIMRTLSMLTGATFSVIGVRRFLSSLIDITGQFEVQKMALRNMLQDVAAADRIFRQLYEFSSESTYRFSELAKYSKQLAAFNIGKDNLLETTKMLGDVASGVGVSMDRLILAYGHVKSSGFLRGIQLRSFSQNGVPILDELAKMFEEIEGKAVSLGEVFNRMMKREIPFEMVEEAFKRMTAEGGKFYKMQEVLSKTLAGQINILKGKWENALYAIGESNDKYLKGAVKFLTLIVDHLQEIGNALKPVIVGFGAYGLALAAASMTNWVVGAARAVKYFVIIAQRTNIATAAIRAFGSASKAAAVGIGVLSAAIAVVVSLVMATNAANREISDFNKGLDELHKTARENNSVDAEVSKIESLYKILKNTNNAYEARKEALNQLKSIVPAYHADLTEEGRLINNNKNALDQYIDALNREAKMKGAQEELAELYKKRREVNNRLKGVEKSEEWAANAPVYTGAATVTGYAYVSAAQSFGRAKTEMKVVKAELEAIDAQIESVNDEIAETMNIASGGPDNYDVAAIVEGIKNTDREIEKIRAKARKGSITAAEKERLDALKQDREDQAKEYEDIMGIKYDKDTVARKKNETEAEKYERLERKRITDKISLYEKYIAAYEKLEAIFEDDTNEQMAKIFGGTADDYNDLDGKIRQLIPDLRKLGEEGNSAADTIEARLGKDAVDEFIKAYKAVEDYEKLMSKWEAKDFNLWGNTEIERKMAKIVSDYSSKVGEIENERTEAINKAKKAHKGNAEAIEDETKRINDLADANIAYEKSLAQDKITALAEGYYKYYTNAIDMDALSTKTRGELDNIRTKILDAKELALKAIDDAADELKAKGFNVDNLKIEVTKNFDDAVEKTDEAKQARTYAQWQRAAKAAAKAASELAEGLQKIGDAAGNSKLTNLADGIRGNAEAMEAAVNGVKEYGGWWGAIIGGLSYVGKELVNDAAIWEEVLASVRRSKVDVVIDKMEELLGSSKGSLGESWLSGLKDAVSVMREMKIQADGVVDALSNQDVQKTFNSSYLNPLPLETVLDNFLYKYAGLRLNLFSRTNGDWKAYQDALVKGYEGAEAYIVKTHDKGGFLNWLGFDDKYSNLKDLVEGLGYDLYDEYGNLNAKGLQAILDTYTKLGAEDREWMEEAIKYSEEYEKAMEKIKETVSDLFSDISGTLADNMIAAFNETGNAVANLSEAFEDLGETFVKSMLESAIYETVLKKYEKDMESLFEEYGHGNMEYTDLLDRVDGLFNNMGEDFEKSADVYNAILDRATDLNWLGESSGSNSLGSGIKSITEDTANLLASYINAIRADVSVMRGLQEKGWGIIETLGVSLPTLNDHIAQIAATNHDIAESNMSILSELRSVIGAPGTSGMVVRVEPA